MPRSQLVIFETEKKLKEKLKALSKDRAVSKTIRKLLSEAESILIKKTEYTKNDIIFSEAEFKKLESLSKEYGLSKRDILRELLKAA